MCNSSLVGNVLGRTVVPSCCLTSIKSVIHVYRYISFLSTQVPGNDDRNTLNALWGKLGSEILMQNWETALEDLNRLKDVIESNVSF